jgi:DNA-binding SARP family transcriptional activator
VGGSQAGVGGSVRIRTLGGCSLEINGRKVPLDGAKPRVRSLMRLLAVHAGAPVHREVIQDALWPDADATAGSRSLHVALSALRKGLDDVADPPGGRLVVRDGDAYRLDVAPDDVDLGRFDRAMAAGRAARSRGEVSAQAFAAAIELYAGDLLPEEGPAEWVSDRRDQYRAKALEAAEGLASEALLTGDLATCVRACHFGLGLDRYQDALWRLLIAARERAGEAGAASRDRREYALVLDSLGVADDASLGLAR